MAIRIGYTRCSTHNQDLTARRKALPGLGVAGDRIYTDHGLTGRSLDRSGRSLDRITPKGNSRLMASGPGNGGMSRATSQGASGDRCAAPPAAQGKGSRRRRPRYRIRLCGRRQGARGVLEERAGPGPEPPRRMEAMIRQRQPASGADRACRVIRGRNIRGSKGEPYENDAPRPATLAMP